MGLSDHLAVMMDGDMDDFRRVVPTLNFQSAAVLPKNGRDRRIDSRSSAVIWIVMRFGCNEPGVKMLKKRCVPRLVVVEEERIR